MAHKLFIVRHSTQASPPPALQQYETLSTQLYNDAIQHLVSPAAPNDVHTTLVCCVLFVSLENMLGRYEQALKHLQAGLRILNARSESSRQELPETIGQDQDLLFELADMFCRSGMDIGDFTGDYSIPDRGLHCPSVSDTESIAQGFPSLQLAHRHLQPIEYDLYAFYGIGNSSDARVREAKGRAEGRLQTMEDVRLMIASMEDADIIWETLYDQYKTWCARFDLYAASVRKTSSNGQVWKQIALMSVRQAFWIVMFECGPTWDRPVDRKHLEHVLSRIELFTQTLEPNERPVFAFDSDIVSALSYSAFICQDIELRRKAISLLRTMRRREGMWDSRELAVFHEALLARLELGEPLEDKLESIPGGIPGWVQFLLHLGFMPRNGEDHIWRLDTENDGGMAAGGIPQDPFSVFKSAQD